MAQTALDVANNALERVGANSITSLSDNSKEAKLCNARIEQLRQTLLRRHPWNFAEKRVSLDATWYAVENIDNSDTFRVQISGHPFVTGDSVTIEQVVGTEGANATWQITKVDSDNFDLVGSTYSGSYVSGGRCTFAGSFDYPYKIALPSDCLRVLRVNDTIHGYDWRTEGRYILALSYPLEFKYIYDCTDYAQMDVEFYDLLGAFLAWRISFRLSQSETLRKMLFDEFRLALGSARFVDSSEDPAEELSANEWVDSRTGLFRYPRDPKT